MVFGVSGAGLHDRRDGGNGVRGVDSAPHFQGGGSRAVRVGMAPADHPARTPASPSAPAWSSHQQGQCQSAEGRVAKRAEDLVLGTLLLVLTLPLMVAIAVAIRLDTAGPALFRQTRRGLNNRPFEPQRSA